MAKLKLTMALSHYDRHIPFFDGTVEPEGIELTVLEVGETHPLRHGSDRHRRMLRKGEFDICELSLSSYLMAKSRAMPFTAIPVFPRRLFSLSNIWVNVSAGISSPKELIGKRVGLNTFQTTLSVLAKGNLQSEYDVLWRKIQWFVANEETISFKLEEGVSMQSVSKGTNIGDVLERGEIDALILPQTPRSVVRGSDKIRRLFSNPKEEELKYFRKNGFYPIMHVVAIKEDTFKKNPWIASSMMAAFVKAKEVSQHYYDDPNWSLLVWGRHLFEEERRLLGEDLWPYGVKQNRANLERFIGYSYDQGLMGRKLSVEELFADSTLQS